MPSMDCQETVVGMVVSQQQVSSWAPTLELGRPPKFKHPLQLFSSEKGLRNPIDCCILNKKKKKRRQQFVNERKRIGNGGMRLKERRANLGSLGFEEPFD